MLDRKKLIDMLIRDEGLRLEPYRCPAGKLTIGIGRNLEDNGLTSAEIAYLQSNGESHRMLLQIPEHFAITKTEAITLLQNDIDRCISELQRAFPPFDQLDDARKMVLINMCFNMGIGSLLGFKKMLAAVTDGCWRDAAHEMANSRWAMQAPERARRLMEIMRTGKLPEIKTQDKTDTENYNGNANELG